MNVKVSFCLCSQSVCLWWRSRVLQPRPIRHRIVDYVTKNWSVGFLKTFYIKFKMHNFSYFRPGRDGAPRFCLPSGMVFTWIFFSSQFFTSSFETRDFTGLFVVSWQLSALLWPAHNPWQPNLWHHLYSAQRPDQNRLRSAPAWDFYVTATSFCRTLWLKYLNFA